MHTTHGYECVATYFQNSPSRVRARSKPAIQIPTLSEIIPQGPIHHFKRYAGVIRLLFWIGHLYLNGMWVGEHQRPDTIKVHVLKKLDYVFEFYQLLHTNSTHNWGTYEGINNHALLIIITK